MKQPVLDRRPVHIGRAALACVMLCGAAATAGAQSRDARSVEGRVLRASGSGPAPVTGQWVVLHRVGSDHSAPLDSIRTDRAGRYRIRYRLTGDPDALYFVSSRYGGIAYFSPPLRTPTIRGGDADVMVFDTTTDTTSLRVQGRHLVVSAPRGRHREIAEIFEIENSGSLTVVARDSTAPLWSTALPPRAESASVAPGDFSPASIAFLPGAARVFAPISPGVRQLVLTYTLPASAFPLTLPVSRPTSVLEVLVEEPGAAVQGTRLAEVAPAPIDGRMFRRFLGQDVPGSGVLRVDVPPPVEQSRTALWVVGLAVAALMLAALLVWLTRKRVAPTARSSHPRAHGPEPSLAAPLIAQLATLDARFERAGSASADQREQYERERAALKERIAKTEEQREPRNSATELQRD